MNFGLIIVKLSGGLGNQLFQYFFGQYLSQRTQHEVKYDLQTNLEIDYFTPRDLGIQKLGFELEFANSIEIKAVKKYTTGYLSRIERKLIQKAPFLNSRYTVENGDVHRYLEIKEMTGIYYFDGYWQSFRFINELSPVSIKNMDLSENLLDVLKYIQSTNSVSIHIRRGDYLSVKENTEIFAQCGLDYYHKSINYFENTYGNITYFVFSDDIDWTKKHFIGDNFVFIDGNPAEIDMFLMSNCKHNILANSTFSWWGAWLNTNSNKQIIAPKDWYVSKLNFKSDKLIPSAWIRI